MIHGFCALGSDVAGMVAFSKYSGDWSLENLIIVISLPSQDYNMRCKYDDEEEETEEKEKKRARSCGNMQEATIRHNYKQENQPC